MLFKYLKYIYIVLLLLTANALRLCVCRGGSSLLRSDSPSDLSAISVSYLKYNVFAAELCNLSIRFFVYEEPYDLMQASHVKWFRGGNGKPLYRKRFSAEAKQEVQVLETLRKHPLRTMDKSNANIFVVPFPVGAVLIDGSGGETFKSLAVTLLNATTFLEQPHVLLSLTTVGFNQCHRKYTATSHHWLLLSHGLPMAMQMCRIKEQPMDTIIMACFCNSVTPCPSMDFRLVCFREPIYHIIGLPMTNFRTPKTSCFTKLEHEHPTGIRLAFGRYSWNHQSWISWTEQTPALVTGYLQMSGCENFPAPNFALQFVEILRTLTPCWTLSEWGASLS